MKFCFDEHPAHFGALFGYCDHQVHKLMGRMLKRYDVSPMQCRTLMFLHDAEDSVNQKTLERHLMIAQHGERHRGPAGGEGWYPHRQRHGRTVPHSWH